MFKFPKKKSKKEKSASSSEKTKAQKLPKSNISVGFSAIINYILEADKNKQIILGKRNDQIFISFLSPDVQPFFQDWFAICRLHSKGEISENTYKSCLEGIKKNYNISSIEISAPEQDKSDTDMEEWDNEYLYDDEQAHGGDTQGEIYTE